MDAAQEIKARLDVADIVGEYLPLKPAGSGSFKALCPFHQEKTPSFYVNRARQSWHCFGCDKGGDLISFVMEMEGLEFREALQHLAQKAGVTLPAYSPADAERSSQRKRLQEVNDLAARFFRVTLLQSPDAEQARAYAAKRRIDDLTGDLFRIGYAPKGWETMTKTLREKGVTAEELIHAGLSVKNEERGTVYDRFRDRLMFTIQDVHGNVVGFTGRALHPDAKEAKYVNTPETAIYKKSAILYGLDKAKGDIKRQDLAVIVEGNMDVVSSHRAGILNVACASGTALTEEQLRLLGRFTKNLTIAFDADAAGMSAALRGLDVARGQDFRVKLITLPEDAGKDPDDAVNKDPELWKQAIHDAKDVMDWVFQSAFKGRNLGNAEDKRKIAADVLPEIRRIADPIVRDHWIQKLATGLSVAPEALRETLARTASFAMRTRIVRPERPKATDAPMDTHASPSRLRDLSERILSVFIIKPELIERADANLAADLAEPLADLYKLLEHAYTSAQSNEATRPGIALSELLPDSTLDEPQKRLVDYLTLRADHDFPDLSVATLTRELEVNRALLKQLQIRRIRERLETDIRAAELAGDRGRIAELEREFLQLNTSS